MVFGLRPVPDSDFRPFQANLDTRKMPPVYHALGTKSIVLKTNSQGGVQANNHIFNITIKSEVH